MKKEILKPNSVDATLFIGLGGCGSEIVKKVADLCINDDTSSVRFVTFDTDVNDLERVEKGIKVTTVQTSSPRTVRDYLADDPDTNNWFPGNNILDDKTVSEGAGQIRAISRLALNATIKNGQINKLYKQIDELFLKNGKDKSHAVKVVIVSTTAGGTGSGISMIMGMLVRHYIHTNYPESAVIIRGFLVLPRVHNTTVIENQSEQVGLLRNGYATIKEINAFMMHGSGFCDSDRRLYRYKDLHITVPSPGNGHITLDGLPFDFCFLMDAVDESQSKMRTIDQYKDAAARTLYEQNIGPMSSSASSKEDNIIKAFIEPSKHGRCRFGGAGSSVLRYPYEIVCEYIASDMAQKLLFGKVDDGKTDEERESVITESWLKYDLMFEKDRKDYENNPTSAENEPELYKEYVKYIESAQGGDKFSDALFFKYLRRVVSAQGKIDSLSQLANAADAYVDNYFRIYSKEGIDNYVIPKLKLSDSYAAAKKSDFMPNQTTRFAVRYYGIKALEDVCSSKYLDSSITNYVKSIFGSKASISNRELNPHMLQKFLSLDGEAIHPNAVRYLLYKLWAYLEKTIKDYKIDKSYENNLKSILEGEHNDYEVPNGLGKSEKTLIDMCNACDHLAPENSPRDAKNRCSKFLSTYYNIVSKNYTNVIRYRLAQISLPYIKSLCAAYEEFFHSFKDKAVSLERKKENLQKAIAFNKGDCVSNLFSEEGYLQRLSDRQNAKADAGNEAMFASIHDMIRENSEIADRKRVDKYNTDVMHDVFDEVMIGYYRNLVETKYSDVLDVDILHAIKLEYAVKCEVDTNNSPEAEGDKISKLSKSDDAIEEYIKKRIEVCRNLARPSICQKTFDEARNVNAMTYSHYVKDGDGLRIGSFVSSKDASDSVSKYELRFFRSVYVIMPTQLFQFCAPADDGDPKPRVELIDSSDRSGAGESFTQYQSYMEDIGPDSRQSAIITPHIDTRWNSISVMPEIDLDYQDRLMRHIHKALIYGFLYDIITIHHPSKYDAKRFVYRYLNGKNGHKSLVVSNKTKCDKFYEVLDALYFDRAAVKSIHSMVAALRGIDEQNSVNFDDSHFEKSLNALTLGKIVDATEMAAGESADTPVSIFEFPIRYYSSMPARKRDAAEIETMIDAAIEAIYSEVSCFDKSDDVEAHVGLILVEQYNIFAGYHTENDDVCALVRRKVMDKLTDMDVSDSMIEGLI